MSHDDDIARLRAEMDQAAAGLKEVARNLWTFYTELTEAGFSEDQAMMFAHAFLAGLIAGGRRR